MWIPLFQFSDLTTTMAQPLVEISWSPFRAFCNNMGFRASVQREPQIDASAQPAIDPTASPYSN